VLPSGRRASRQEGIIYTLWAGVAIIPQIYVPYGYSLQCQAFAHGNNVLSGTLINNCISGIG